MTFGAVIDTAIGLVLVFLLFAMLLGILNEVIAGVFALRAKALENAIAKLIQNPDVTGGMIGRIFGMFGRHAKAAPLAPPVAPGAPPTQLDYTQVYDHPLVFGAADSAKPSYVSGPNFASALVQVLGEIGGGQAYANVEAAIKGLPDGSLKTVLLTFLSQVGGDLDKLRAAIETWFDSAMDRLSGQYKRFTQVLSAVLGLTLAIGFNVDAVNVAGTLYAEPTLRSTVEAAAERQAKTQPVPPSGDSIGQAAKSFASTEKALGAVQPVGWAGYSLPPNPFKQHVSRHQILGGLLQLLGWVITAIAGLLGAPFWFDALQGLVNVRNAGPKPTSTTSDGSS